MKKILFGAVAITTLLAACNKSDSGDSSSPGSWKVDGTTYTATTVTASTIAGVYMLSGGTGSAGITFVFNGAPAAGSYRVISNYSSPGANQCRFLTGPYWSTGTDNVNATVTVNGGKVSISMPDAEAENVNNSSDVVMVSANLTQQ